MKKQSKKTLQDPFSLEGDGIIENFFHILWAKDPIFGTIPSVFVPHTVILRFNQPIAWYFMKDGALKKKTRKNLNLEHIKEVFLRNKNPSGIVAVFMRYKKVDSINNSDVIFEYFNEEEFLEFIKDQRQINNGVLQHFVQPKGDKNYIITANWSPKLCFFEKTESLTRINDPKYDIYDRVLTIEAENFHSKEGPLRGYVLPNKIQRICGNIAQHIQNVTFETIMIARMILQFKVDENSRIWFMVCSSLRLENPSQQKTVTRLNLRTEQVTMKYQPEDYLSKITVPTNIKTNIIKGKPINMHKIFTCTSCDNTLDINSVFEGTYKTIIEGYEWDHLKSIQKTNVALIIKPKYHNVEEILERLQGKSLEYDEDSPHNHVTVLVPPLLKKIHPYLTDEVYKSLRHHIGFLKKSTVLCQECLLGIQNSQDAGLKAQKETAKDFYGTGSLQPERLKVRYQKTAQSIRHKGPSQTTTSFPKFYFSSATTRAEDSSGLKSDRSKRNSGLPQMYSELQGTKDFITIHTMNTDNEDNGNLSIDSNENGESKEVEYKPNKVMIPIKEARPVPVTIKVHPKENRVKSIKSIHVNPELNSHRLLNLSTPKKRGLIDELSRRENSLGSTSGMLSTRSDKMRTKNYFNPAKDLQDPATNQYISSSLIHTLTAYMPKKKFLMNKYKSLKSISGATTERSAYTDVVEKILQAQGNQSARNLYYNMETK